MQTDHITRNIIPTPTKIPNSVGLTTASRLHHYGMKDVSGHQWLSVEIHSEAPPKAARPYYMTVPIAGSVALNFIKKE